MNKIKLIDSHEVRFPAENRYSFIYKDKSISKILSYPERRVEPELNLFVNLNADIVQGGYKWWANPAHLMYDCLSDYFVARSFFPDIKISLKSHKLGSEILKLFSAVMVEGCDNLDREQDYSANGLYSYVDNPWRFNGLKHQYLSQRIRADLLSVVNNVKYFPKNIIIKRRLNPYYNHKHSRNIHDLDRVVSRLNSYGLEFSVIDLEDYDVADQMAIFAGANVVISTHGSALVWLNLCRAATVVIELIPPYFLNGDLVKPDFWFISQSTRLIHMSLICPDVVGDPKDPYDNDVIVDPDALCNLLDLSRMKFVYSD